MAFIKCLTVSLLFFVQSSHSAVTAKLEAESFIFGGNNVPDLLMFPSFVGIVVQEPGVPRFCSGVILNENHVLTAGSCVLDTNQNLLAASQLFIRGGNLVLGSSAVFSVMRVYVHPLFSPFNNNNDLAVLRLGTSINLENTVFEAANLNHMIVAESSECSFPGWNVVNGQSQQSLQFLKTEIFSRDLCSTLLGRVLDESMICAIGSSVGSSVCESNVGGPMYCNGNVSAILSFGTGCGQSSTPGVYTQIRYHEQWILDQFERNDIPQAGPTPAPNQPGSGMMVKASSVLIVLAASVFFANFCKI